MENIFGVIVWIIILLVYFINKGTKKQNKPNTTSKTTKSNTEGNISKLIQELVDTQKQNKDYEDVYGDDEARSLEVIRPEIRPKNQNLPDVFKSRVAKDNVEKEENIANRKNRQSEVINEYQEFIQDPDNLRKAFILKEIFDRKF